VSVLFDGASPVDDTGAGIANLGHRNSDRNREAAVLARSARFEVKLATTGAEIRAAQRLRYKAFFVDRELDAPSSFQRAGRVFDPLDDGADHLIVIDRLAVANGRGGPVVGTCRTIRQKFDCGPEQFCASPAFDLAPVMGQFPSGLCEISRACVHRRYRRRLVVEKLWAGLFAYATHHRLDAYFGAASLPGANPLLHRPVLDWLTSRRGESMTPSSPADRALRRVLPPLLRAYLDAGATVAGPTRSDPVFNTTDVLVWMDLNDLPARHRRHFFQK